MKLRDGLRLMCIGLISLAACGHGWAAEAALPQVVEFNRDIRPILADNCYACHGPDKNQRKAELRLDKEEGAFARRDGYPAITPGKLDKSELYQRITNEDVTQRMPPRKFGKQLAPRQIALIGRWIEQGANWQKHWSLIAPKRQPLPAVVNSSWPGNAIDRFVLARLEQEGLKPSPEADRRTLIRRLSFDLTGLPPAPEEVDAFLADSSPEAYEKAVDRLLASKHYGERMALYWLDLVRYGDTGGYHSDNHRDISLYRDYVIQAFNNNKPFDQFTIEQLAGDLLEKPTLLQKIASGYNRLLMTTEEGGAQAKEYLAKYAADRVRNASSVWMAATLGCCECHDHKFDPYMTKEFYRFAAFFADLKEAAVGRQEQSKLPTEAQAAQLRQLDEQISAVRKVLGTHTPELEAAGAKWVEQKRAEILAGEKAGATKKGGIPSDVLEALLAEAAKRTPAQEEKLAAYYRTIAPELGPARQQLADLERQKAELDKSIPSTLISIPVSPRVMRVLPRGNWLDDSGEIVAPGVPAALARLNVKERRATRLDLAQWLVARDNPVVARVFVNRLWKLAFGQGIVKTLDDFGAQGAWPTHPELLDWLAVEFIDSGWDVKHMLKLMVLSRTYRQSSAAGEPLRQHDPYNRLLARQASFRLDAEMVRDNALAVSGLLSRKIGGPSAKPYQPPGYWAYLNFPTREWQNDKGEGLYRRGLYTYWQRTFPHPSLLAFDAPSREECTVERPRSNTPLQALVLLNDPTYVEAARVLAERMVRAGDGVEPRIQFAYRQALCRQAGPEEVKVLSALSEQHFRQFRADQPAASALISTGDYPVPKDIDAAELAAWTSVARVVLNLHETITRN
jgi:hypothetical protein